MIFYTADLHFHYEPFLPSRPFGSVEEMGPGADRPVERRRVGG